VSLATADIAGRLQLRLGSDEPVRCVRPVVSAALMLHLTRGRRAVLIPDLLGALFTLCAPAHRLVSRRAIRAALGDGDGGSAEPGRLAAEQRLLALLSARDHLQRLALDLPSLWPVAGVAADPGWLRAAPLWPLPGGSETATPAVEAAVQVASAALPRWLERELLGAPPAAWLAAWLANPDAALARWAATQGHPLARWYAGIRALAQATRLPCRALDVLDEPGTDGLRGLALDLAQDGAFAEHPLWLGAPAETGPWTRRALRSAALMNPPLQQPLSLWHRLGSRLAEVVALAMATAELNSPALPALGAITLAPGQALAWCEMSRGLLLHAVQLEAGTALRDAARVADYRVLAPTEWNFHPQGTLAQALRAGQLDAAQARLATLALDPCVGFDLIDEREGCAHA
jgi:hypothetical protein